MTRQLILRIVSFLILAHWGLSLLFYGFGTALQIDQARLSSFIIFLCCIPGIFIFITAIRQIFKARPLSVQLSYLATVIMILVALIMWGLQGNFIDLLRDRIISNGVSENELLLPALDFTDVILIGAVQLLLMLLPLYMNQRKNPSKEATVTNP